MSSDSPALSKTSTTPLGAVQAQRLYEAGPTDLVKLLQMRRRFIEARHVEFDAVWLTTQAYSDLPTATGGTPLLSGPARRQALGVGIS